jgi:hypothetical protein
VYRFSAEYQELLMAHLLRRKPHWLISLAGDPRKWFPLVVGVSSFLAVAVFKLYQASRASVALGDIAYGVVNALFLASVVAFVAAYAEILREWPNRTKFAKFFGVRMYNQVTFVLPEFKLDPQQRAALEKVNPADLGKAGRKDILSTNLFAVDRAWAHVDDVLALAFLSGKMESYHRRVGITTDSTYLADVGYPQSSNASELSPNLGPPANSVVPSGSDGRTNSPARNSSPPVDAEHQCVIAIGVFSNDLTAALQDYCKGIVSLEAYDTRPNIGGETCHCTGGWVRLKGCKPVDFCMVKNNQDKIVEKETRDKENCFIILRLQAEADGKRVTFFVVGGITAELTAKAGRYLARNWRHVHSAWTEDGCPAQFAVLVPFEKDSKGKWIQRRSVCSKADGSITADEGFEIEVDETQLNLQ